MKQLLKDIAVVGAGQGAPQGDSNYCDNGTPFVKAGNLQELLEGKNITDIQKVSEEVAKVHRLKLYPKGTILFAKSGMSCMKGYVYVLPQDAYVVSHLACITPIDDTSEYLKYYFIFHKPNQLVKDAAYPLISLSDIGTFQIDMKSELERKNIVSQLNHISNVISLRQQELQKLDDLVKARFIELFVGKDYPLIALDDLSLGKGEYGAQSASTEYDPSRPRYVRITDINDDGTLNDDVVSSVNVEDDEQYKLSYGDFMFARMGATVGKTYAYKSGNQIFAGYLIRYKLNLEKIMPEYLYAYTKLDGYKNWVVLNQSGAAQPGINAKKYGSLQIPVAPLEEQKAFEDFVKQVDKSKVAVQKALDEAQLLFDSLMQKYFG